MSPNVEDAGVGGEEGLEGTVDVANDTVLRMGVLIPVVLSSFVRGGGSTLKVGKCQRQFYKEPK